MSLTAIIKADINDFNANLDKARAAVDEFAETTGRKLEKFGSKLQTIGGFISVGITAPVTAAGVAAYNMAAEFEDALGATDQIFKDSASGVKEWAGNLETYFGISKQEALEYSNLMGSMLVNIGNLTDKQAAKQGAKLIELAGDLTAMYGGRTQDAVRALTGALKGNNTMLDNYGMAVNDALVKTRALELGLIRQGQEMSLSAKQAATLSLIYEQTAAAQGQAAREAEGASGSMRAFQTEIANLTTEIGANLLPIVTPMITRLKEIVQSFRQLSPETQKVIFVVTGLVAAIGPLLLGLGTLLKMAPLVGAAFTFMTGPIGIAITAISAAAVVVIRYWDDIKRIVLNSIAAVSSGIAKFLKFMGASNIGVQFEGWAAGLRSVKESSVEILDVELPEHLKQGYEESENLTKSLNTGSEAATKAAKSQKEYREELVDTLASWGIYESKMESLNTSFAGMATLAKRAGASLAEFQAISSRQWVENSLLQLDKIGSALTNTSTIKFTPTIEVPSELPGLDNALNNIKVPFVNLFKEIEEQVGSILETGIQETVFNFAGSIGSALADGSSLIAAGGAALLGGLGGIMVDLGKMAIQSGITIEAVKTALSTLGGFGAIAAGAALVAVGSAFRAGASRLSNSMRPGAGSVATSSSGYGSQINPDYSQWRGAYYNNDRQKVEFEIAGNKLKGVLNINDTRDKRLG